MLRHSSANILHRQLLTATLLPVTLRILDLTLQTQVKRIPTRKLKQTVPPHKQILDALPTGLPTGLQTPAVQLQLSRKNSKQLRGSIPRNSKRPSKTPTQSRLRRKHPLHLVLVPSHYHHRVRLLRHKRIQNVHTLLAIRVVAVHQTVKLVDENAAAAMLHQCLLRLHGSLTHVATHQVRTLQHNELTGHGLQLRPQLVQHPSQSSLATARRSTDHCMQEMTVGLTAIAHQKLQLLHHTQLHLTHPNHRVKRKKLRMQLRKTLKTLRVAQHVPHGVRLLRLLRLRLLRLLVLRGHSLALHLIQHEHII